MPSTILLSDNGASSGSAGLKQTAGNDGVLILQTTTSGGTATNAVYVDTSQQLGFNTSSPAARLHANDTMASSTTYQTEMILQAQPASGTTGTSSAGGVQLVFRGTTDGSIANSTLAAVAGFINTNAVNNAGGLLIRAQESAGTGLVDAARVTSNGLIALRGATNLTSGTGIAFPASQSASTDANTLDDYEEGTWTPTLSAQSGSITQYTSSGVYTKVGNLVTVQAAIQLANSGTASGTMSFGALPFTCKNVGGRPSIFLVRENAATGVCYQGLTFSNATTGVIATLTNGSASWTTLNEYTFCMTYQVA